MTTFIAVRTLIYPAVINGKRKTMSMHAILAVPLRMMARRIYIPSAHVPINHILKVTCFEKSYFINTRFDKLYRAEA
jgi:hypothetical protein